MLSLCHFRALNIICARMTINSNLKEVCSCTFAASLRPVKVKCANLNFNFLLKRHYIRPKTGERSRAKDALPKGYVLIYKERSPSLMYSIIGACYLALGASFWHYVEPLLLDNPKEKEESALRNIWTREKLTTNEFHPIIVVAMLVPVTTSLLRFAMRTPIRMYRKNDDLVMVLYGFLGPLNKKVVQCSVNDIKRLEPIPRLKVRRMQYMINGKIYTLMDYNFLSVADVNCLSKNKTVRTRLNDFWDMALVQTQKWFFRK